MTYHQYQNRMVQRVVDRPSEISTDTSPSEEALLHFAHDIDFDIMVFIQASSPLIQSEDVNKEFKDDG